MIPGAHPLSQYLSHKAAIDRAIADVLSGGHYILGEQVRLLESEFATYAGAKYGIGVANGTDALHLALRACGIGSGDEVITVSHTAVATVAAIELAGATPVFADIDPLTYAMDPASAAAAITPRTKALIPVHIYGHPAPIVELLDLARRSGLRLIEDCCQAHGAAIDEGRVGSFGDLACFSFYPTKNLGGIGDGGIIVTSDDTLHRKCLSLRQYGWAERYISRESGINSRLDELQAAILRVKLPHLDEDNRRRAAIAARYSAALGRFVQAPGVQARHRHVFHLYVVQTDRRDALLAHLQSAGIGAGIHYPQPVHQQPAYESRFPVSLPVTECLKSRILSLPVYPELSMADVDRVISVVTAFFEGAS